MDGTCRFFGTCFISPKKWGECHRAPTDFHSIIFQRGYPFPWIHGWIVVPMNGHCHLNMGVIFLDLPNPNPQNITSFRCESWGSCCASMLSLGSNYLYCGWLDNNFIHVFSCCRVSLWTNSTWNCPTNGVTTDGFADILLFAISLW